MIWFNGLWTESKSHPNGPVFGIDTRRICTGNPAGRARFAGLLARQRHTKILRFQFETDILAPRAGRGEAKPRFNSRGQMGREFLPFLSIGLNWFG
jgi:hypothetical protein